MSNQKIPFIYLHVFVLRPHPSWPHPSRPSPHFPPTAPLASRPFPLPLTSPTLPLRYGFPNQKFIMGKFDIFYVILPFLYLLINLSLSLSLSSLSSLDKLFGTNKLSIPQLYISVPVPTSMCVPKYARPKKRSFQNMFVPKYVCPKVCSLHNLFVP